MVAKKKKIKKIFFLEINVVCSYNIVNSVYIATKNNIVFRLYIIIKLCE